MDFICFGARKLTFEYFQLKTLQSAHERELATCQETIRLLQQRLAERDEAFAVQKRRKVPIDYFALKAKVSFRLAKLYIVRSNRMSDQYSAMRLTNKNAIMA